MRVVQPALEKRDTEFRLLIPIEKQVAIILWRLSTGNSFRTVRVGKQPLLKLFENFWFQNAAFRSGVVDLPRTVQGFLPVQNTSSNRSQRRYQMLIEKQIV